jgi:hypothetical protein
MRWESKRYNHFLFLLLSAITIISSFFPYVAIYSFGTDIQPIFIMFILVYSIILFYCRIPLKNLFIFLLLPFFLSCFLMFLNTNLFASLRSVLGYAAICFVPIVFLFLLQKHCSLFVFILKFSTIVYLVVGLIQLNFNRHSFSFLLNRLSTQDNRGVTSLTPEPTVYGLICLFFILFFISLNIKNKRRYIIILLLQIIIIAQSSMVILFLFIFLFYHFICNLSLKYFSFGVVGLILALYLLNNIGLASGYFRVLSILKVLFDNPTQILALDASINDRASAIYFSIKGFVDNYFLPSGLNSYGIYLNIELPKQSIFLESSTRNRIMSYYGGILYELGIFGLLIPITYSLIIIKSYASNVRSMFLYLLFVNTILFSAIPMSFPFVGIYLACLIHRKEIKAKLRVNYNPAAPDGINHNSNVLHLMLPEKRGA